MPKSRLRLQKYVSNGDLDFACEFTGQTRPIGSTEKIRIKVDFFVFFRCLNVEFACENTYQTLPREFDCKNTYRNRLFSKVEFAPLLLFKLDFLFAENQENAILLTPNHRKCQNIRFYLMKRYFLRQ